MSGAQAQHDHRVKRRNEQSNQRLADKVEGIAKSASFVDADGFLDGPGQHQHNGKQNNGDTDAK